MDGRDLKKLSSLRKRRGGYYTPKPIADFLAAWAVRSVDEEVLDPSCGDGVLLESVVRELLGRGASKERLARSVLGVELDSTEAEKARIRLRRMGLTNVSETIREGDFFSYCRFHLIGEDDLFYGNDHEQRRFDIVIGNPPFIRYQHFNKNEREIAFDLMRQLKLRPNRLTNAWVPFIPLSAELLREDGRLAMVVPAELLQVSYAAELRRFLSNSFSRIAIFTFRELLFEGVQQEVVLLCAERGKGRSGITLVELNGVEELPSYVNYRSSGALKHMDHSTEKWTQYYLTKKELDLIRLLRQDKRFQRLGDLASVDVGVVTGRNDFFVLTEDQKARLQINGFTKKIVTRSAHLAGVIFREADWRSMVKGNLPSHLLNLPQVAISKLPREIQEYIKLGEEKGVQGGYKCRIRKHWYSVPSVWTADAFMLRQIHRHPKIILNETNATCTDTIHRMRFLKGTIGERLTGSVLNSATFAFSEIGGRSYGGGVLELEPTEAESLLIPYRYAENVYLEEIHKLLSARGIDPVLELVDRSVLQEAMGLSKVDIIALRRIWQKLLERRIFRKRVRKSKHLAGDALFP